MELYKEILISALEGGEIKIEGVDRIILSRCYKALEEIVNIIRDFNCEDGECFWRIEKIVQCLEGNGIYCGGRHDFG